MAAFNQRGQILIESVFAMLCIASLLVIFQMMIENQKEQSEKYRLSKTKKDILYVEKNENFKSK